jgi:hypothetical protein
MKCPLSLLLLMMCSVPAFGQLTAHAGNDTTICLTAAGFDTLKLGGNPAATGGVGPYTFIWSTRYKISSHTYGAAYFLDDSTLSNPGIIIPTDDYLIFKLTVIDAAGTSTEDSVTIRFSRFLATALECIYNIRKGDTVALFCTITKELGPLSFSWSPNYHISDTAGSSPYAWPDTTTEYHVYVTDSIGCVAGPQRCSVMVNPTGTTQIEHNAIKAIVFPNPIGENSTINLDAEDVKGFTLHIITSNGQTVLSDRFSSREYAIGKKIPGAGLYLYVIKNGLEIVAKGQFVK